MRASPALLCKHKTNLPASRIVQSRPTPTSRRQLSRVGARAAVVMTSTPMSYREDVRYYGHLLYNNLFAPKFDLYKIPGPPGYWLWGARVVLGGSRQGAEHRARAARRLACLHWVGRCLPACKPHASKPTHATGAR